MNRFLFVNFAGLGNLGDDLLLCAAIKKNKIDKINDTVYFYNGSRKFIESKVLLNLQSEYKNFHIISSYFSLFSIMRNKIDKVIVSGGQLIQDFKNPVSSMMATLLLCSILAKVFGVNVDIERVGVSVLTKRIPKFYLYLLIQLNNSFSVRDDYSQRLMLSSFPTKDIKIEKDFVLDYYNSIHDIKKEAIKDNYPAICLSGNYNDLSIYLESRFGFLKYYSMVDSEDYGNNNCSLSNYDIEDIINIISKHRVVITNRLHFAILAHIAKVKEIYILDRDGYKLKEFARKYGYSVIDYDDMKFNDSIINFSGEIK